MENKYSFGEKKAEYSQKQGKEIPVWISPKFEESRRKAVEILDSGKYGLSPADFWILMNETKSGKMGYTGLIISHNGCLKINDKLDRKFDPSSVTEDKNGYGGALVYTYCNSEQGIYEVGEVTAKNCKNDYPYAMAFKRMFDRVVLKLSKLAYSGIYSEAESDSFKDPVDDTRGEESQEPKQTERKPSNAEMEAFNKDYKEQVDKYTCHDCRKLIEPRKFNGKLYTYEQICGIAVKKYGVPLCWDCMSKRKANESAST